MLKCSFKELDQKGLSGNFVICLDQSLVLSPNIMIIDQKYHGIISKITNNKELFSGKFGASKMLIGADKDGNLAHILLVGIGQKKDLQDYKIEEIGGKIYSIIAASKMKQFSILCEDVDSALLASGATLASYKFNHYFSKDKLEDKETELKEIHFVSENSSSAKKKFEDYASLAKAVFFARDLISEPPNILFPESYSEKVREALEPLNISVEILGERDMEALGMGALLCVGQGSVKESKLVVMKYDGADEDEQPIAFVGKGVTFDSGGISIKPSAGMEDMKYDMAGSAAVVGAMMSLASRNAKVNAVGVIALVENMPGGNAQRPSDVVRSMSGKTIEVLNTDAEGRLILSDALWYVQEKFSPKIVVDLATLTGAITIALGQNIYAGLFSNDDKLSENLTKAGELVHERLWRFPVNDEYDNMINSEIADMKNVGEKGAGSITAAQFLHRFIKKDVPWAHIDIAGVAWNKKGASISPKGAVGFGVRLLDKLTKENYESE
jgi:leucyl aminopeptidase